MSTAWAFCLAYNESKLIGYWVRHYRSFCDKVIVFVDKDTTDNTAAIAKLNGADVREYDGEHTGLDDGHMVIFANTHWQESLGQTDWVIWTDVDELLYHPHMQDRLDQLADLKVNLPHLDYYVMVSDHPPEHHGQVYDDPAFRRGVFVGEDSKVAIFNPNTLPLRWYPGKHRVDVIGHPVRDEDRDNRFKLLHYRWLGKGYLESRDKRNYTRLSQQAKDNEWCVHLYPEFTNPYDPDWQGVGPSGAVQLF